MTGTGADDGYRERADLAVAVKALSDRSVEKDNVASANRDAINAKADGLNGHAAVLLNKSSKAPAQRGRVQTAKTLGINDPRTTAMASVVARHDRPRAKSSNPVSAMTDVLGCLNLLSVHRNKEFALREREVQVAERRLALDELNGLHSRKTESHYRAPLALMPAPRTCASVPCDGCTICTADV